MQDKDGQEKETPENGQGDPDPQNPDDKPENGGTGDPEKDNQPDEPTDGLTDDERTQMETLEESYRNAQQKISADGDEKAQLRRQLEEKDATIAALSRQNTGGGETSTAPGATDDDPYAGIDLEKIRQENPDVYAALERQHNMIEKQEATYAQTRQQQEEAAKKEEQFGQYQTQYGLSRQQFDTIWAARQAGNHFDADSLLNSYSKVNSAKRQQQEQQQADRSKVVNGNSQSQPNDPQPDANVQAEVAKIRELKDREGIDAAIMSLYERFPEAQANAIVNAALQPNAT